MLPTNIHLLLFLWLSSSSLPAQAAKPDCSQVADFGNCLGNTLGFCPKETACGCKNQKPYCKCPSYRNKWDYWYMGPKCDHLWSTLDLILVTVVPAVALAVAAIVLVQWVGYCRSKSNAIKRSRIQVRKPILPVHDNPGYFPEQVDKTRYKSQPQGKKDGQDAQVLKFPKLPLQNQQKTSHPERFSYPPLRSAQITEEVPTHITQYGHWTDELSDTDYEELNPFSAMPMQQFVKPKMSFPSPDYDESNYLPKNYLSAQKPYKIGRPNIIQI